VAITACELLVVAVTLHIITSRGLPSASQATVLTPAAARRIGAQHARVKLGRLMHGITGDIPAGELELRSFTIGGVEVPRTTQRNAAITD
jgi:hypothetical protein